ncbi:substrate-binding domain-containing protein [Actinoplanes sp. NPDC051851]|uniref:substrate-binding domain-containing protein n=1 Tax=Actinoplanes sp. NPDC051851 TaxID=3154753 RepID=UPI00342E3AB2
MPDLSYSDPVPPDGEYPEVPPSRTRTLLAGALVVLVLVAAGGIAWRLMRNGTGDSSAAPATPVTTAPSPSASPCPDPELHVAAAPEIAPVIREAAATLTPSGQRCATVAVDAEEPGVTAAAGDRPDVWIPSSSLWLKVAAAKGGDYTVSGDPLGYSPVVLAGPEAIKSVYAPGGRTSWAGLIQGAVQNKLPVVQMPDPEKTTTGLLSLLAVRNAAAQASTDAGIAQLQALTLRSRLQDAQADPTLLLSKMGEQADATNSVYAVGVFPSTEQQVEAYRATSHPVQVAGVVPGDGRVDADYPYAIRKGAPTALAKKLRTAVTEAAMADAGFRDRPSTGTLELPADPTELLGEARQWTGYRSLAFQVLLLIDASGSMNQKITGNDGRTTTKAALLRESGASAAQLFGEDTSIGMWFFGGGDSAHTEEVAFGPISQAVGGKARRELMATKIGGYRPVTNAGTPLFQTVLDGVDEMRGHVREGTATVVVVLTDGSDGGTRFSMSQATFLKKLSDGQDPAKPVPVIAVGYGSAANTTSLQAMAKATGGKVIGVKNPADLASGMAQAFLAAHAE